MLKQRLIIATFCVLSACFTAFVFLNTYEVVFNKDIPIAHALQKVGTDQIIDKIVQEFQIKQDTRNLDEIGAMEQLSEMDIPELNIKIDLQEARRINNTWYQQQSLAHYIGLNKDDYGNTVDYLIYTNTSWRTVMNPDQIQAGMDVKIAFHGNLVSNFQVSEKSLLPLDQEFIATKTEGRQIILLIDDSAHNRYYGFSLVPSRG